MDPPVCRYANASTPTLSHIVKPWQQLISNIRSAQRMRPEPPIRPRHKVSPSYLLHINGWPQDYKHLYLQAKERRRQTDRGAQLTDHLRGAHPVPPCTSLRISESGFTISLNNRNHTSSRQKRLPGWIGTMDRLSKWTLRDLQVRLPTSSAGAGTGTTAILICGWIIRAAGKNLRPTGTADLGLGALGFPVLPILEPIIVYKRCHIGSSELICWHLDTE